MDVATALRQLAEWGNPTHRKHAAKRGAGQNQFGVMMGALRDYAKRLERDHGFPMTSQPSARAGT